VHAVFYDILFALWFFVPAGLANGAPPLAAHIPLLKELNTPLDFGRTFRGKRIFGANKTWRGLIIGVIVATIVVGIEKLIYLHSGWIRSFVPYDYGIAHFWALGPLLGAGALLGDAVESFFKRQLDKQPGTAWVPFDQIDYIVGGLLASMLVVKLSLRQYLLIALLWYLLHMAGSTLGYLIGVKDKPI
jgi:CDP-2,3-bis-(O-geranylgeranyl)-sn-glycerol synthase